MWSVFWRMGADDQAERFLRRRALRELLADGPMLQKKLASVGAKS